MKSWNSVLKREPKVGDKYTIGHREYEVTGVASAGIYVRDNNTHIPHPPGHGHVYFSWDRLATRDITPIGNEKL